MAMYIPFSERPVCSKEEARQALGGIGLTLFHKLVNEGRLKIRKMGDKTVVDVPSVLRLAEEGASNPRPRRPPVPARRDAAAGRAGDESPRVRRGWRGHSRPGRDDDDLPPAAA
jgi:hypothetical protein